MFFTKFFRKLREKFDVDSYEMKLLGMVFCVALVFSSINLTVYVYQNEINSWYYGKPNMKCRGLTCTAWDNQSQNTIVRPVKPMKPAEPDLSYLDRAGSTKTGKQFTTVPSINTKEPKNTSAPSTTFKPKHLTTVRSNDQNVSTIKTDITTIQPQQHTSKSKGMDSSTSTNAVAVNETNASTTTQHSIVEDTNTEFTRESTTSGPDLMLSSTTGETTPDSPIVHSEPTVDPDLITTSTDGHEGSSSSDTLTEDTETPTTMLDFEIVTMYDGVEALSGESATPDSTVPTTYISNIHELIITEIFHTKPANTIWTTNPQVTPADEIRKTRNQTTTFEVILPGSSSSTPNTQVLETSESMILDDAAITTEPDLDGVWIYRPVPRKTADADGETEMTIRPTISDDKILTDSPHTNPPLKMSIDETQSDPTDQILFDLSTETPTLNMTEAINTEDTSKTMESVSTQTTPTMLNNPGNYDSDKDYRMSEYGNHNHPNMSTGYERVDSDDSTNGTWTEDETFAAMEPEIHETDVSTTTEMDSSVTQSTPESMAETSATTESAYITYPPTKAPMIWLTTPLIAMLLSNVNIPPEFLSVPIRDESRDPLNLTSTLSPDSLGTSSQLTYLSPDVEETSSELTVYPGTPAILSESGNYDSDTDYRMSEYVNHNHPNMSTKYERIDSDYNTNGTSTEDETTGALESEIYEGVLEMEPSVGQSTPESIALTSGTSDSPFITYPPTKAPMIWLTTPINPKLLSNVYKPAETQRVQHNSDSTNPLNLNSTQISIDSLETSSKLTYLSPDIEETSSEPTVTPGNPFNSQFDGNDQSLIPPSYDYQINLEMTDDTNQMSHTIAPATSIQTTTDSGFPKLFSARIEPPIGMSTGIPPQNKETNLSAAQPDAVSNDYFIFTFQTPETVTVSP